MKTILLALLLVAGPASLARLKRQSYGGLMGGGGGYGGGAQHGGSWGHEAREVHSLIETAAKGATATII